MAENGKLSGRCLCGAVSFTFDPASREVGACHCGMCRRWSSGPMLVVDAGKSVSFTGEENVTVYKSSEWGERGFCSKCGTNLFWRMADRSHFVVSAGALEKPEGLSFKTQIFVDEKPDYYDFANDTAKMTGEEVFALFSGGANTN